jgi:hypothetical protein
VPAFNPATIPPASSIDTRNGGKAPVDTRGAGDCFLAALLFAASSLRLVTDAPSTLGSAAAAAADEHGSGVDPLPPPPASVADTAGALKCVGALLFATRVAGEKVCYVGLEGLGSLRGVQQACGALRRLAAGGTPHGL